MNNFLALSLLAMLAAQRGSSCAQPDVFMQCPEGGDALDLDTFTCSLRKSAYPSKCISEHSNITVFRYSVDGTTAYRPLCTLTDILGACPDNSTAGCSCGTHNATHYNFEYTFKPSTIANGYYDCFTNCRDLLAQLYYGNDNCENKRFNGFADVPGAVSKMTRTGFSDVPGAVSKMTRTGFADVPGAVSEMTLSSMFNCRRTGISCEHGSCNTTGTSCNCDTGYLQTEGYHCVPPAPATPQVPSPLPCVSRDCGKGGVCFKNANSEDQCYCNDLHYGDTCQYTRVNVTCGNSSMSIRIDPMVTDPDELFAGLMYVSWKRDDSDCQLTPGIAKDLNFGDCGMSLRTAYYMNSGNRYSLKVVVQYNRGYLVSTDQELTLRCTYPYINNVTGVIQTVEDTNVDLEEGTVDNVGAPDIALMLRGPDGPVTADTEMTVGTNLDIDITFTSSDVYKAFLVVSCFAANSDNASVEDYAKLDFVDGGSSPIYDLSQNRGCPLDTPIVRGDHILTVTPGKVTVTIPLYAFMFVERAVNNKNTLFFSCLVTHCTGVSHLPCREPLNCKYKKPADMRALQGLTGKRRRRAADDSMVTLGQTLTVRFGNTTLEDPTSASAGGSGSATTDTEQCLKNPELQTTIAVLGFFLLCLFLVVCVLVFVLCRRSRPQHGDKFVNDGFSMGSSQQTLHLLRP